jgi:outer membrane protein W
MKKRFVLLTVLVIALVFPAAVIADDGDTLNPTRKGRIIVDADFHFLSGSHDIADPSETTTKHRQSEFDLHLGYTIINNLQVGIFVGYNDESAEVDNPFFQMETADHNTVYGIFARYYFGQGSFKPFVGVHYGIGASKEEVTGTPDAKHKISTYGGDLGLIYFLNDHFAFELFANYSAVEANDDDAHDWTFDMDGTNLAIGFGFLVAF